MLAQRLRGKYRVYDLDIPDLGIVGEKWPGASDGFLNIEGAHRFAVDDLVRQLKESNALGATFLGYAQRLEYYDLGYCRRLARPLIDAASGFDEKWLVFHVRAGDAARGNHPDYRPMPLRHFDQLIRETGLRPAFVGQVEPGTLYGDALIRRFPTAHIVPSVSVRQDFLTLLGSKNLALPVSSFSWLAAWLSRADTIHMPIGGLFDPKQRPDVDLLPRNDKRYRFYQMPAVRFSATPEQLADLIA